jgi:Cu2+-exporting ATPase
VFAFSVSYNALTVVAGLCGMLSPLAAAVLMPLSSLATLGIVGLTFRKGRGQRIAANATHLMAQPT